MTESKWLTCTDPEPMLEFLRGKFSDRKLRLFSCACCRNIWNSITDERSRHAIVAAEAYADNQITPEEFEVRRAEAQAAFLEAKRTEYGAEADADFCYTEAYLRISATLYAAAAARATVLARADQGVGMFDPYQQHENEFGSEGQHCSDWAQAAVGYMERARTFAAHGLTGNEHPKSPKVDPAAEKAERRIVKGQAKHQANLLRHNIGNPFRPYSSPDPLPTAVIQLADALYKGEDCGFALHDALLEAGHAELAEHFHGEQRHPKGCWALDLVMKKE